jgi:hypothetical protein
MSPLELPAARPLPSSSPSRCCLAWQLVVLASPSMLVFRATAMATEAETETETKNLMEA